MNQYARRTGGQLYAMLASEKDALAKAQKLTDAAKRRHMVTNHKRVIKQIEAELKRRG